MPSAKQDGPRLGERTLVGVADPHDWTQVPGELEFQIVINRVAVGVEDGVDACGLGTGEDDEQAEEQTDSSQNSDAHAGLPCVGPRALRTPELINAGSMHPSSAGIKSKTCDVIADPLTPSALRAPRRAA